MMIIMASMQRIVFDLNDEMRTRNERMQELKDNIRYAGYLQEAQPVIEKLQSVRFKKAKERMKDENADVLRRYYLAKRIMGEKGLIDKLDTAAWSVELEQLRTEYQKANDEYHKINKDCKMIRELYLFAKDTMRENRGVTQERSREEAR